MRNVIVALSFLIAVNTTIAEAQSLQDIGKRFSLAITASEVGYDAGVGIEATTPAVLYDRIRFRLKVDRIWLESYKAAVDNWATYNSAGASFVYNIVSIERSLVYAEIGTHILLPSTEFSDVSFVQGISTLVGVDLFILNSEKLKLSYFMSGGVTITKAHAEKLEGSPAYGNGFLFSFGLRAYF